MQKVALLIFCLLGFSACQEANFMDEFKSTYEPRFSIAMYPSTIRMINLQENPQFDQTFQQIEKLGIYMYNEWYEVDDLTMAFRAGVRQEGYEELFSVNSKDLKIAAYENHDSRNPNILAYSVSDSSFTLYDLHGMVDIAKLPDLMNSFSEEDFINPTKLFGNWD